MFKEILKNKMLMLAFSLLLLGFGVYRFVTWREERLQKRELMLPTKGTISMGNLNDQANFKIYIDSSGKSGSQLVYFHINTEIENNYGQFEGVYKAYKNQNPFFKYKDWSNIELVIRVKSLDEKLIYEKKCYPLSQDIRLFFDYKNKSNYAKDQQFKVRGHCSLGEISGGYYNFNVKVTSISPDFKEKRSVITLYAGMPNWNDIFNELLDFVLSPNL